ncbi:MAG: hypothetical protein H6581_25845 [Bacteroidia bacterium]|nr:hypothetical protein [Bacteroidia bacterium]
MNLKRTLLLLGFSLLFCSAMNSQTLEFSKVVRFTLKGSSNNTSGYAYRDSSITIPPGKVWKVTSANASLTRGYLSLNGIAYLYGPLSNNPPMLFIDHELLQISSAAYRTESSVIWLPQGTYAFSLRYYLGGSGWNYGGTFSAIEFNVVP